MAIDVDALRVDIEGGFKIVTHTAYYCFEEISCDSTYLAKATSQQAGKRDSFCA